MVCGGRRGASSERQDSDDHRRATDPFNDQRARCGSRRGKHGHLVAGKTGANLVEAGGGPGPSDARVAVGKQAGVRAAVGGERREERAIGMPAARDRGSRPGVIGRNLWRRMGLGPFRKREG